MLARHMLRTAAVLGLFAVLGTGLVALTFDDTRSRIATNERTALLQNLHALIPPAQHDNELLSDTLQLTSAMQLGTNVPVTVYRARQEGRPVAAVFSPVVAPDGYSGPIKLLVAVHYDGSLTGVRVLSHKETPGLGDFIEEERSDWIFDFTGRSLTNPAPEKWKVKKDGGLFDQATGATITPRAIVTAVYNCLEYFKANRDKVFATFPRQEPIKDEET